MRKERVNKADRAYREWLNNAPSWVQAMIAHDGCTVDCALLLAFRAGREKLRREKLRIDQAKGSKPKKDIKRCRCGHSRDHHVKLIVNDKIVARCLCLRGRYPNRDACDCKRFIEEN